MESGELCDEGEGPEGNSDTARDRCRTDCTLPRCGDGVKDSGEACDGSDIGVGLGGDPLRCADLGYPGGALRCQPGCAMDLSECEYCGNGRTEGSEVCDGTDLGGATCSGLGFYGGDLSCRADCSAPDPATCGGRCGDGILNGTEVCDGSDFGSDSCQARGFHAGGLECDATCSSVSDGGCAGYCGDGACDSWYGETLLCCEDCVGYVALTGGAFHNCALASDGGSFCWGNNDSGQLGVDCQTRDSWVPVQVTGLSGTVSDLAAGDWSDNWYHYAATTCALLADSTVTCWGHGRNGELGTLASDRCTAPVPILGLSDVVRVTGGGNFNCALRSDGSVWCWGLGDFGQLGNGTWAASSTPVMVSALGDVVSLSAGSNHSCAVRSDGTAWCWGYGWCGGLGNGSESDVAIPIQVPGLTGVVEVAVGHDDGCARRDDGSVWCWGCIRIVTPVTVSYTPIVVPGISGAEAIAAGWGFACAALDSGAVWCWGYNGHGQLGDGTTSSTLTPVQVSGVAEAVSVVAGWFHTCALRSDGTVWCWGANDQGQLGDGQAQHQTCGTRDCSLVPVQVIPPP